MYKFKVGKAPLHKLRDEKDRCLFRNNPDVHRSVDTAVDLAFFSAVPDQLFKP